MGARPHVRITPAPPRRGRSAAAILSLLALVLVALTVGAGAAAPARAAAARGIVDWRLEAPEGISDLSTIQPIVDEMGPSGLNAKYTRVYFRWARLQPYAPGTTYAADGNGDGYDDAYVAELEAVVGAFKAAGIKVIMTGTDCPRWASDTRYSGSAQGAAVVPAIDKPQVKTAWQDLARYLAEHFGLIGARYFEVWNEPNLSSGLYPQLYGAKKTPVGPAVYLKMLKAFSTAAHKADKGAVVIAGATSRRGANDAHSTSPQWFAAYLKDHGGAKYFDAYSHHPYTPPGASPAPGAVPKGPPGPSRSGTSARSSRSSRRSRSTSRSTASAPTFTTCSAWWSRGTTRPSTSGRPTRSSPASPRSRPWCGSCFRTSSRTL